MHGGVKEAILHDAPVARGKEAELLCYVDADHNGDHKTIRLQTVFIILFIKAPTDWYSKRHNTVESAVFGLEFVAQKTAMEHIRGLRYMLHMMGVPIAEPTYMYGEICQSFTTRTDLNLLRRRNLILSIIMPCMRPSPWKNY